MRHRRRAAKRAPPPTAAPAGDGEARGAHRGPDRRAGTELRSTGHETGRDARPEDAEAQQRERGEHDGQRLVDRRLGADGAVEAR